MLETERDVSGGLEISENWGMGFSVCCLDRGAGPSN